MRTHRLARAAMLLLSCVPVGIAGQATVGVGPERLPRPSLFVASGFQRISGAGAEGYRVSRFWSVGLRGPTGPGTLLAQADVGAFQPEEPGRERYDAISVFGGYLLGLRLPGGLRVSGGPTAGLFRIRGPNLAGPTEDEIVLGGRAELLLPSWRGWEVAAVGDAQRVHFHMPVDLLRVGVRLGREVGLPRSVVRGVLGPGAARPDPVSHDGVHPTGGFESANPARTLTREELDRSGVDRLQHLPSILDGWTESSPNGIASHLAAPGGLPFDALGWRVFVDGVEFPLAILGTASLSSLPLSLSQVDSIRIHDGPAIVAGRMVAGGALHLFTSTPEGPRLGARISGGNGAGDPGLQSPGRNLDRLGGGRSALVGYGADAGGFTLAVSDGGQFVTDPEIRVRTRAATAQRLPGGTHSDLVHRTLSGGVQGPLGTHRLQLVSTSGRDFFFLGPLGGERVAENRITRGTLSGYLETSARRAGLSYQAGFTRRSLDALPSHEDTGLGFEQDLLDVAATASLAPWTATVEARRVVGRSARFPMEGSAVHGWKARVSKKGESWLLALAGGEEVGGTSLDAFGAWSRAVSPAVRLHGSILAGWISGEDPSSLWFWERRGYGLVQEAGITVRRTDRPKASPFVVSDLGIRYGGERLAHRAELGVRIRSGLATALPTHTIGVRDGLPVPGDSLVLDHDVRGGRATFWVAGSRRWPAVGIGVRLDGRLGAWGDAAWRDALEALPDVQAHVDVNVRPAPDIDLGARVRYTADTYWATWDVPASEVSGVVPGGVQVDLSGRKTLFRGRAWASMRLEDLLNTDRPSHPFGHSPGLRLHLQGVVALGAP